jgi:glutamate-1-semialdehyde aminotransferase
VIFGHAPDFLLENVARRLEMGQVFGAQLSGPPK